MPQTFAEGRMLDLIDRLHAFDFPVRDPDGIIEQPAVEPCDREVGRMIDRRPQHGAAAVLFEVLRIVGAAAEKADAKGCLRDEHRADFSLSTSARARSLQLHKPWLNRTSS